jgi:hypothetical protein
MQVGVTWALYHLPSTPQKLTLFTPVALPLEHIGPGTQGAAALPFFFAASDGAAESAIAATATAPVSRIFEIDIMLGAPLCLMTHKELHGGTGLTRSFWYPSTVEQHPRLL